MYNELQVKKFNKYNNLPENQIILIFLLILASILFAGCDRDDAPGVISGIPWIQYFSPDFTRVSDIGIDPQIDLNTGQQLNDYSRIWIGLIKWPDDQTITLSAEADNGLRLFVEGQLIIDGWITQSIREARWQAPKETMVPIRVEYFQDGGNAYMRLYWSWAGHPRELIPASAYFHSAAQKETVTEMAREIEADLIPEKRADQSYIYQAINRSTSISLQLKHPFPINPGPHVLIGDNILAEIKNVKRMVCQPVRDNTIPNPLIKADRDRCFQPFFTVLHSPEDNRYHIWYGAWRDDTSHSRSHLAYMTSEDGILFKRPTIICSTPEIQFGSEVIDRGPDWSAPAERYIYIYWLKGGSRLLVSPDGINWRASGDTTIIAHNHDITGLWWDPLRGHYIATISTSMHSRRWIGRRRTTMQSYSTDLVKWTDPVYVLYANPEKGDEGDTQFYAMSGYLVRGPLVIAMVKVLRDDLIAEGVAPGAFGRAHTSLAWSYDGIRWIRDLEPYFEPDPDPLSWDHAHAWIDEQLIVGDSTRLYYGGYKQGHKMNRFRERQIGLVRIPRDRYVAWENVSDQLGEIQTIPMLVNMVPERLELNAIARSGAIKVAINDSKTGKILEGLSFDDCVPVTTDGLSVSVKWGDAGTTRRRLRSLEGRTIQINFMLNNARIYAFTFE